MQFAGQLGIREPHEVLEVHRQEFCLVGVFELEFELGPRRRVGKRIRYVGEQARAAQSPRSLPEIRIPDVLAQLQPGRGHNLPVGIAHRSSDLDRDQPPFRSGRRFVAGRFLGRGGGD